MVVFRSKNVLDTFISMTSNLRAKGVNLVFRAMILLGARAVAFFLRGLWTGPDENISAREEEHQVRPALVRGGDDLDL